MTTFTILLGADECAESDDNDWISEATDEEIGTVVAENPGIDFGALSIDSTGRPYYWRTVNGMLCPSHVLAKAARNLRVSRWA